MMDIFYWVLIILGGWLVNGISYVIYDDVFQEWEEWPGHYRLRWLIRVSAIVPYSFFLAVMVLMWGLIMLLLIGGIVYPLVLSVKGLIELVKGR